MNGVYVMSLVLLVIIAVYLGRELYKVLREDRKEARRQEEEIEEAILAWMNEPSDENKFAVEALIEKYKVEKE